VASLEGVLQGALPPQLMARLTPLLANRKALGLVAGALGVALLGTVVLWSWGSDYSVLYAGLSGEEGGRTLEELQKLNIPYRITEGGRVILVPTADAGRARLQLAARGIPKHDGDEWALLDNESLGVSPFVEQVHYVRGVESALSRTVGEVDGVVSAKVSLAMPKDNDFLGDSPKPSASVLVRLRPGMELTSTQVDGIIGLVASSVPGLSRDNVTIVDQTGRALTADGKDGLQAAPQQLEFARAITHRYEATITDLLAPVLGRGNFRVSADADVDFSQSKESLVKYGASHVLSQDETVHSRSGEGDQAIGIPGALSNRRPDTPVTSAPPANPPAGAEAPAAPPPAAAKPPSDADSHKITNYDIDRTVQYLEHPAWTLRSISVAVLINNASGKPLPAARLDAVRTLVASAVGAEQSPHITVVDLPFETAGASVADPAAPWWTAPWMAPVERNALLAVAGMLALFGGVFPLLRRVAAGAPAPVRVTAAGSAAAGAPAATAAAANANAATRPPDMPASAARARGASQDVFSIETETVLTLVHNDPARTAQVIRGWIAGDRNSLRQAS
jgi:flagellar M-ring protein FliF